MADLEELEELATVAGAALQEIQREIGGRAHVPEAAVRFPRGYVRTTAAIYATLPDIGDHTKRRNLAYQLMMADVCRWLLSRTDIFGQVRSVVISDYICILAFGVEFFVKARNYRKVSKNRRFEDHTARLVADGVIDADLKNELDWMWDIRTHEHLDATADLRHCAHKNPDFTRATKAWTDFLNELLWVF